MEVITIDSSDDEKEVPAAASAAASSSGQKQARKKSPNSSEDSAEKQNQEVIALLDDSSDDDDVPVHKMDRKRKARPCIEDEIIELESSAVHARKPAARKRAISKNSVDDNDAPVIPFHLFETSSSKSSFAIPQERRKYFKNLREVIGLDVPNRQIQWLVISNFLIDFRYVYDKIPDIVQIPRVVVFYSHFPGGNNQYVEIQDLIMRNWKAAAERNGNSVDFVRMLPSDPPRSKTNPLPVKITYGCHHTKMFLTGFDDQVACEGGSARQSMIRVVVHTANLGQSDVEYQTNGFYAQNFPLKKVQQRAAVVNPYKVRIKSGGDSDTSSSTAAKSSCSFENDLADYMESYCYNTRQSWCAPTLGGSMDIREARLKKFGQGMDTSATKYPLQQAANAIDTSRILTSQELSLPDLIRQYDYTSAYAALIPSVPGYHSGTAIHKYGYLKLRREIIDAVPSTSQSLGGKRKNKPPIVCQISSLGSLHENWLRKFCAALDYTSTHNTNPLDENCMSTKPLQSLLKIVWPTVEEISSSAGGVAGGASVPGKKTNLGKPFLKPLYHRWSKREFGKDPLLTARHIPHIKTIVQPSADDDRSIEWLLLSSHNLSKTAWGQVQNNKRKGGRECFISHWELGVFFSPATLLEVCGMTKPVRIRSIGYGGSQDGDSMISLCDDHVNDDRSNDFINVHVPIPHDVHTPDAYDGRDEYWSID